MAALSNSYKNSLKKLRKNSLSLCKERVNTCNYFQYLTEVGYEDQEDICDEIKEIVREKIGIDFNDLPEDTIYI